MRIGTKIYIFVISFVIIISFAISSIVIHFINKSIDKEVSNTITQLKYRITNDINNFFQTKKNEIRVISQLQRLKNLSTLSNFLQFKEKRKIERDLQNIFNNLRDYTKIKLVSIKYAEKDNKFVAEEIIKLVKDYRVKEDVYTFSYNFSNVSSKNYIKKAVFSKKIEPLIYFDSKENKYKIIKNIFSPLGNNVIGLLIGEIRFNVIADIIQQYISEDYLSVFVSFKEANRGKFRITKSKIDIITDNVLYQDLITNNDQIDKKRSTVFLEERPFLSIPTNFVNYDIYSYILFDKDKYYKQYNTYWLVIISIMLLISLMTILTAIQLVKKIVTPIKLLTTDIARFGLEKSHLNTKLSNRKDEVGILTQTFNKMFSHLKELQKEISLKNKLAAIGQTTAMLAHDVRKPFAFVKAFLDEIREKRFDDDFIRNSEIEINRSLAQVENMIEDTLEFTTDRKSVFGPCNPQSMINASLRETFKIFEYTDISFRYDLKHTSYLNIDAMKGIRVFNNIIGNAVEAMEKKGEIWFETRDLNSNRMEIVIGNSGPAIEKEDIVKIFDPFFTKGKQKGTGLGLAISRKIVNLHGGDIKVESDKINGTEFILTFPILPGNLSLNVKEIIKHSREIKYEPEKEAYERINEIINEIKERISQLKFPLKILIVDDEPLFRSSLRNMIAGISELRGYLEIIEVSSGEEALKLAEKDSFPYVISDIDMGEENMDGFEFTKRFLNKRLDSKVVIHSNWNLPDTGERSKDAGAVGFIAKPMTKLQFVEFLLTGDKEKLASVIPIEKAKESIVSTRSKIVIIDDDEYIANYTKNILGKDYYCAVSLNAEDGIQRAKEVIPDLIICDLVMPEKDGIEVCKELKTNENTKHIPIIILTGKTDLETKIESLELGASEFLTKPFNKVELQSRVKSLLNQNRLSNLIKKKNIELSQALRKLKDTQDQLIQSEKMASLGRLASGMAHEIRNPINFIQNAAEPIQENFKEITKKGIPNKEIQEINKDTAQLFGIIQEGVDRILGVVAGINSFTRGAVHGFQLYNINEAVESSLSISTNEYISSKVDIKTDLKAAREIKCNRGQINQVVLNLLINAFEAVKEKKKAQRKVQIKTWEEDGQIKLSIKDNGLGIKEENKQRIFDPFFTTKETKPGQNMGLGLSICYNIIDVHQGRIDVNSSAGKGAEFIVSLPVNIN